MSAATDQNGLADFPKGAALVVGGSGGIGQAICERLAAHGADVALTYRTNKAKAEATAALVRGRGRRAEIFQLSLEDPEASRRVGDDVTQKFGKIHTVVYASGPDIPQRFISQIDPAEWRRVIDADVNGFFNLVHATLPHVRKDGGGSFVAITTAAVRRYAPRDVLSSAPKAAVEDLMKGIAKEEGRFGVRANAVALGVIETGLFLRFIGRDIDERTVEAMRANTALKRFGTAREVADAVTFLASARAGFITGQVLTVDGGFEI
ncbi:MAG: SDR family oxidoreductase [Alphaproteobacteria bacterium]